MSCLPTPSESPSPPLSPASLDNIALMNGCQPFRVILDRLSQEKINFWIKKDEEEKEEKEEEEEEKGYEENEYGIKESPLLTIDLENCDASSIGSNKGTSNLPKTQLEDKIFCLFNLEEFDDRYEATQTYYRELRYAPFRCFECDEATIELKGMVDHYLAHHPTIKKAQYWIEEVPAKEKWVEKFISYQIDCNNEEDDRFPNAVINKFCPVCNQFEYLHPTSPADRIKVSNLLDMNHINKHLRYNPYECLLCRKIDRRYAISSINKKAQDHLIERHNLPKSENAKKHFRPSATIPELENFLREYFGIIRETQRATAKPVVRRKPLAGKSNRQNASKGKQLYKQAAASYKKIRTERESSRTTKKANTSSTSNKKKQVIEYREEDIEDYETYNKEEDSKFYCIFCPDDNLSDIYSAWGHYGMHLKYTPIVCGICSKAFTSDTTFRYHGIEHVEHADLPFTRNCDDTIETWGHDFLGGLIEDTEAKPEFAEYCPVCAKIFPKALDPPHLPINTVKAHIYSHLKYHPYECLPCQSIPEKSTFVGDLDYQAALHLNTDHAITVTPAEITNYFVKSRGIESLDKYLADHFVSIHAFIGTPTDLKSSSQSAQVVQPSSQPC